MRPNPLWEDIAADYNAAIVLSPEIELDKSIFEKMTNHKFYTKKPGTELLWQSEASKLTELVRTYL